MTIASDPDVHAVEKVAPSIPSPKPEPDLSICDREPIHIPGSIQPQGALLTVRPSDFLVTQASANLSSVLGLAADMSLGQPLYEVLGRPLQDVLGHEVRLAMEDFVSRDVYAPNNVFCLAGPARTQVSLRAHRSGQVICVEIESLAPNMPDGRSSVSMAQSILRTLAQAATVNELCALAARELKELTGYDRVMIYRFDDQGNGEVVGEALEPVLAPFIGLHYPATDIPVQARQIFLRQRVRLIGNIAYVPVPILSDPLLHDGAPLDMTLCALRGVSPVHIEYLGNMGVVATFAVALSYSKNMWGLVVGHHGVPRWMDTEHRAAIDIIGQMMSSLLQTLCASELHGRRNSFGNSMRSLGPRLAVSAFAGDTLAAPETELLQVTQADGAMIRVAGRVLSIGKVPPAQDAMHAMAVLSREAAGDLLAVDDLGLRYPELASCTPAGSGALLLPLSPSTDDAILWFRPEALQTVTWGGDPKKPTQIDASTERLSPRKSFEAWKELVRGRSLPWRDVDLIFARELLGVIQIAAAARNKEQQRLFEVKTLDLAAVVDRQEIADGLAALTSSRTETDAALEKLLASSVSLVRSRAETQKTLDDLMANEATLVSSRLETRRGLESLVASTKALTSSRTQMRDVQSNLLASTVALASSQAEAKINLADLLASEMVNKALGLANDLLKATEKTMLESETRFRSVVEAAPSAMVIISGSGMIELVNMQAERVFGYQRDEMLGKAVEMLVPKRFRGQHPTLRMTFFSDPQSRPMGAGRDVFGLRKDGTEFPVEIGLSPIEINDGTMVLSAIVDISERHENELVKEQQRRELEGTILMLAETNANLDRLSKDLAIARDRAEQAGRAKSSFLAGMSHELRTPLNGILGYAQMLRLEGGLNATQSARVDAMLGAGSHLLRMISSVLDMSEIEAEHVTIHVAEVDLSEIAAECLDVVGAAAETKGLPLSLVTMRGAPLRIMTDATRLRQVLLNLLGNALKFTESGSVELRLQGVTGGTGVRIEVADTGPGIPPELRARLFQDFARHDSRETAAIEGSGLGLALAARLAKLLGGRIGQDNNPGGGSLFWLELPLAIAGVAESTAAAVASEMPGPTRRLRVLVADDVEMNREIVKGFLQGSHDVTCVVGGAEAVAAAANAEYDVILMDVRMPEVDGLEATRRIRGLVGARGQVPIVGLTAQAFAEQVAACRKAGMDAHVPKPFSPEMLLQAVINAAATLHVPAGKTAAGAGIGAK